MSELKTETQLIKALHANQLFGMLDADDLRVIADQLEHVTFKQGDTLIAEGDTQADSMYILVSGTLVAHEAQSDMDVNKITTVGDSVGEVALLTGEERTASIRADSDVKVIRVTKAGFEKLLAEYPTLAQHFADIILPRVQRTYLAEILSDLLGEMTLDELHQLERELTWQHLKQGDILFEQGSESSSLFIVINGRLRAKVEATDLEPEQVIGEIATGETVGEVGLLSDSPRSATVYAIRESYVVQMHREAYLRLASTHPQLTTRIAQIVIKRQQELLSPTKIQRKASINLTFLPITNNVDLPALMTALRQQIEPLGSQIMLDKDTINQQYNADDAAQRPLDHPTSVLMTSWLTRLENQYDYLLFAADNDWSAWTERCVQQADRVILVADANAQPDLTAIEKTLQEKYPDVRYELILLHPQQTEVPTGTRFWLDARNVTNHYHIRLGETGHYKRAARRLTGHAIGFVLSGGGARGYSHIGVLGTFEQNGVQVDMIGGTSIGGVVAGAYAKYGSYENCLEFAEQFGDTKKLLDYTVPIVSIMASYKVTNTIESIFGDMYIEDSWIPYFCVASDISKAEAIIYKRGLFREAIRASLSIPAVFSPVMRDGSVVVDGGLMNSFPLDIMHEWIEGGTLIGSMAKAPKGNHKPKNYDIGEGVSGWKLLWERVNPFSKKKTRVPTLPGTVLKIMEVNSLNRLRSYEHLADLIVYPDVRKFGILQFSDYAPIIEEGRISSQETVIDWLKTQPDYISS